MENLEKLIVDVTPELNETLDKLSSLTNSSKSEVVNKAVELMKSIIAYQKEGKVIGVVERLGESISVKIINFE